MSRAVAARFLFRILCIAVALVSLRVVGLGLEAGYPAMIHHLPARDISLATHVVAASLALLVLPVQFLVRLRARRPALHRWTGRIYAAAVLAGGLSGVHLSAFAATGAVAGLGFATLAVLWIAVTANAVAAAISRDINRHRRWMIASAALTFAAVTLRIELPLMLAAGLDFATAYPLVAWMAWVPNLVLVLLWTWRRGTGAPAPI